MFRQIVLTVAAFGLLAVAVSAASVGSVEQLSQRLLPVIESMMR